MKHAQLKEENKTVHLSKYDNNWYRPGSAVKIASWMIVSALFFNHPLAVFSSFKCILLQLFGARVGKRITIKTSVNIKYPWLLEIANDVWIGEKVWIDNLAHVYIGNNVCISQGAMLVTGNHNYKSPLFDLKLANIILEDGVWLGAKSIVCPGIICRSHAVLSVASVATKDLEAYTIYQGNPAEKIKERLIE
jgi:putative colanic acid biosynthesis acetyltransferase WcaF